MKRPAKEGGQDTLWYCRVLAQRRSDPVTGEPIIMVSHQDVTNLRKVSRRDDSISSCRVCTGEGFEGARSAAPALTHRRFAGRGGARAHANARNDGEGADEA
jgi:hypothetical protein